MTAYTKLAVALLFALLFNGICAVISVQIGLANLMLKIQVWYLGLSFWQQGYMGAVIGTLFCIPILADVYKTWKDKKGGDDAS